MAMIVRNMGHNKRQAVRGLGYHVPRLVHDFPYDFSKNSDLHIREHLLDIVRVGGAGLVDEERPSGPVHRRFCSTVHITVNESMATASAFPDQSSV